MNISTHTSEMIRGVRTRGEVPDRVAVSPDLYKLWEQQNGGVEPCTINGLPILIRDNYKPMTTAILGKPAQ